MIALALLVAALDGPAPAPATPAPAPAAWCARARELSAAAAEDPAALDEVLALLPAEAAPISQRTRALAGEGGSLGRAWDVVGAAVREGCPVASSSSSEGARAAVAAILARDARFGGARQGDDIIDRIEHKVKIWIVHLFESAGMGTFASSARTVYLSILVFVVVLVGVRLVRNLVKSRGEREEERAADGVERQRKRAFAAWRADAAAALAQGKAREALRAGQAALLARVGELDERAVTPARTHREIVARLRADVAGAVQAPLRSFDAMYFGKDAGVDDAAAFLKDVDAAEARLRPSASAIAGAQP